MVRITSIICVATALGLMAWLPAQEPSATAVTSAAQGIASTTQPTLPARPLSDTVTIRPFQVTGMESPAWMGQAIATSLEKQCRDLGLKVVQDNPPPTTLPAGANPLQPLADRMVGYLVEGACAATEEKLVLGGVLVDVGSGLVMQDLYAEGKPTDFLLLNDHIASQLREAVTARIAAEKASQAPVAAAPSPAPAAAPIPDYVAQQRATTYDMGEPRIYESTGVYTYDSYPRYYYPYAQSIVVVRPYCYPYPYRPYWYDRDRRHDRDRDHDRKGDGHDDRRNHDRSDARDIGEHRYIADPKSDHERRLEATRRLQEQQTALDTLRARQAEARERQQRLADQAQSRERAAARAQAEARQQAEARAGAEARSQADARARAEARAQDDAKVRESRTRQDQQERATLQQRAAAAAKAAQEARQIQNGRNPDAVRREVPRSVTPARPAESPRKETAVGRDRPRSNAAEPSPRLNQQFRSMGESRRSGK